MGPGSVRLGAGRRRLVGRLESCGEVAQLRGLGDGADPLSASGQPHRLDRVDPERLDDTAPRALSAAIRARRNGTQPARPETSSKTGRSERGRVLRPAPSRYVPSRTARGSLKEPIAARGWLTVFQLPPSAHELNPVEPVSHLKRSLAQRHHAESNSPFLAPSRNASHSGRVKMSAGPDELSLVSLTATRPSRRCEISTQLPL
jgi:hypothetical protein